MPSLFQRPISVFQLHEPLVIGDYRINAIEIPCPKPGKRHPHGLEHAEFVIKSGALAEFVAEHSAITFDRKAMNKAVNPDVSEQWCGVLCLAAVSVCACLCVCVRTCVFARACVCSSCCLSFALFWRFLEQHFIAKQHSNLRIKPSNLQPFKHNRGCTRR